MCEPQSSTLDWSIVDLVRRIFVENVSRRETAIRSFGNTTRKREGSKFHRKLTKTDRTGVPSLDRVRCIPNPLLHSHWKPLTTCRRASVFFVSLARARQALIYRRIKMSIGSKFICSVAAVIAGSILRSKPRTGPQRGLPDGYWFSTFLLSTTLKRPMPIGYCGP